MYICFHPIYYLRPSVLSFLVVTQMRGHIAGSSSPPSTTVRALLFHREMILSISSLVDSGRIVLTHARRSQQLILFLFLQKNIKISPRRDSNSRTNTSSIRGLPLFHRDDLVYIYLVYAWYMSDDHSMPRGDGLALRSVYYYFCIVYVVR